jgi:hypothetical protein
MDAWICSLQSLFPFHNPSIHPQLPKAFLSPYSLLSTHVTHPSTINPPLLSRSNSIPPSLNFSHPPSNRYLPISISIPISHIHPSTRESDLASIPPPNTHDKITFLSKRETKTHQQTNSKTEKLRKKNNLIKAGALPTSAKTPPN